MIHRAMIEITVNTEKLGTDEWVTFQIKADPKVPPVVDNIHFYNYPAVLIAGKIMEMFTDQICEWEQMELELKGIEG